MNAEKSIGAYRVDPPKLLEQATGHPTTEFSTLLFQDIRSAILGQYSKHNAQITKLQTQVRERLRQELTHLDQEKTSANAILTASKLIQYLAQANQEAQAIQASQASTSEISAHYRSGGISPAVLKNCG